MYLNYFKIQLSRKKATLLFLPLLITVACIGQNKFADGEIEFSIQVTEKGNLSSGAVNKLEEGKLVYNFKNHLFRSDMHIGTTEYVNVHNSRDHTGLSLIKAGEGKNYVVRMGAEDLKEEGAKFDDLSFTSQGGSKKIAGYICHKALAKMTNGAQFEVYYTKELQPVHADYNPRFKGLGGIPLQFQVNIPKSNAKLTMTATEVKAGFQPSSLFEIPKTGFRELTYKELRALRNRR